MLSDRLHIHAGASRRYQDSCGDAVFPINVNASLLDAGGHVADVFEGATGIQIEKRLHVVDVERRQPHLPVDRETFSGDMVGYRFVDAFDLMDDVFRRVSSAEQVAVDTFIAVSGPIHQSRDLLVVGISIHALRKESDQGRGVAHTD